MGGARFALSASLLLLSAMAAGAQNLPVWGPGGEDPSLLRLRDQWFYGQRAYPLPSIPPGVRLVALARLRTIKAAAGASPVTLTPWRPLGPQPEDTPFTIGQVSGRVTALAVDPTNATVVYLGAAQGGVWKTTNGGANWLPLTDNQASLATGSIALDPRNPSTVYVGTGEENFSGDSYYGAGILKSTDGGASWTQICGPFCGPVDQYPVNGSKIGAIAIDPGNSQVLLAAASIDPNGAGGGVFRSADGGNSWTQVLSGDGATGVLFDPGGKGVAYAALGNVFPGAGTEGVFKSSDDGQTWGPDNGGGGNSLPLTNAGRIVLALAPSAPGTLLASIAADNFSPGDVVGVFKSTDGGGNWTLLSAIPDYCLGQCFYDNTVAFDPVNANIIYAGGSSNLGAPNLVRSLDGGGTWSALDPNFMVHTDMHALAFSSDGGTLYLGGDGGAYATTDVSATSPSFANLNSTLSLTLFYPGLSADAGTGLRIAGTQDNYTVAYENGTRWKAVTCGDGGYTAIDSKAPNNIYAACIGEDIRKSSDGGGNFNLANSGIDPADRVAFIAPLVMDPKNTKTLYFGTDRIYQTVDGAGSWNAISPDLTNGALPCCFDFVTAIAVARSDSNTVYAGTGDSNLWVTTNALAGAGATWTKIDTGLPPRYITALAVDPKTPRTAYASFSGFSGFVDHAGHVFMTTNGGGSWTDISGNLPNIPVNAIVVYRPSQTTDSPVPSTQLFIGTDIGVLISEDGGRNWGPLGIGLPNVAVLGLTLEVLPGSPQSPSLPPLLIAATHGRGAWQIPVPVSAPPRTDSGVSR